MNIEECAGYKRLLKGIEHDEQRSPGFHDYRGKLVWIIARAKHYAEKTGIPAAAILDAWEARRDYWYMNFYQEASQPSLDGARVRVFDTLEQAYISIGDAGFRCPKCKAISTSPYACTVEPCDWKVYGLFRDLGKGMFVFVKEKVAGELLFMPVAWENESAAAGEERLQVLEAARADDDGMRVH